VNCLDTALTQTP